jgi:hypothetical protein
MGTFETIYSGRSVVYTRIRRPTHDWRAIVGTRRTSQVPQDNDERTNEFWTPDNTCRSRFAETHHFMRTLSAM